MMILGPTRDLNPLEMLMLENEDKRKDHSPCASRSFKRHKPHFKDCGWVCPSCKWSCTDDTKRCLCRVENPSDAYVFKWDCPKHGYTGRYS